MPYPVHPAPPRLVEVGANNAILLGLDGCHDIGHLAGALGVQRCEQRAFAGQSAVRRRLPDLVGVHIEHFVFNADHFTEAECDMAAHYDIAMIGRRRFVERTCRVGSPIGEDRLVVFVGQSDTPDVSVRTVDIVESAEHQAIFDGTQLVRRSSYMVAKESRSVRCVGDPCEPAARTVSRRARAWPADHPSGRTRG